MGIGTRQAWIATAALLAAFLIPAVIRAGGGQTTRVSVSTGGEQSPGASYNPALSGDGRFIAFVSNVALVDGKPRGGFVHDRETVETKLYFERTSFSNDLSGDGRFVSFQHLEALVPEDTNGEYDVYRVDRDTGEIELVSYRHGNDAAGNDYSDWHAMSGDGRFIAFRALAADLVPHPAGTSINIYLRDLEADTTEMVSVSSDEEPGNGLSHGTPAISATGRYVAFESLASNLVPGDIHGTTDVFVRDVIAGETTRVSVASDGTPGNGHSGGPAISGTGRFVAFDSTASNLVPGDTNARRDVFVHDRGTGETTRVSIASDGSEGNHWSRHPSISADGQFVAFESAASNLIAGDTAQNVDIFVHDRLTGTTQRVSVASDGTEALHPSWDPDMSPDGRFVGFESEAWNLVPNDTNSQPDVFVHELAVDNHPSAGFIWTPETPLRTDEVTFYPTGDGLGYLWDFDSDGTFDSTEKNPVHSFTRPGPHVVTLATENGYGLAWVTKTVNVLPTGDEPYVTSVSRQYPGFFLERTTETNLFDVGVDWKAGGPGRVGVQINDGQTEWVTGTAAGISYAFDMDTDFPSRWSSSTVTFYPENGDGIPGLPWQEILFVFPFPLWLEESLNLGLGGFGLTAGSGEITYSLDIQFPDPPLAEGCSSEESDPTCLVQIPDWVPYIGGDFSLAETYATVSGDVSTLGTGSFGLAGTTGFTAMDNWLTGSVSGTGTFRLSSFGEVGLETTSASFALGLDGTIQKSMGMSEAVPQLKAMEATPVIGSMIKKINERAQVIGEVSPSLDLTAAFEQINGELQFANGTGTLGFDLKTTLEADLELMSVSTWVGGGGSLTAGVPEPLVRQLEAHLQAGVKFTVGYELLAVEQAVTCSASCTWTPEDGTACVDEGCRLDEAQSASPTEVWGDKQLQTLERHYESFGPYSRLENVELDQESSAQVPAALTQTIVVSNVFPEASPALVETSTGRLLLWSHQDPADPVLQSTEMAWSFDDGSGWSPPALVGDDTRVELSPLAAVDATGKVVAVWLRIKDAAFSETIETFADLPKFYSRLEVVGAVFDPVTRIWSGITALTDDTAMDSSLALSASPDGEILLTWLTNPAAAFMSTAAQPSSLRFSQWNAGGESWSAPVEVATGLVGVRQHAAARSSSEAMVVLERDPDLDTSGDSVLDLYRWDGSSWSSTLPFATGGDNGLPKSVYDAAGEGHVLWVRGSDLVQATLSDPTPAVVREASESLAFFDSRLLVNPDGNLTLLRSEASDTGAANLVAAIYDTAHDVWGTDRRLTLEPESKHRALSPYYATDGKLHAAFLATSIERVEEVIEIDGVNYTFGNIPRDLQTDLRVFEHTLETDLAVDDSDLSCWPVQPRPGEAATATLVVHNAGDFAVGSFRVDLWAGEPSAGGILLATSDVLGLLAAGESVRLEMPFVYIAGGDLVALVDAGNEVAEVLEDNNEARSPLGNLPPVARLSVSATSGVAPLTVHFDGTASGDPEGTALTHSWAFATGSPSASGPQVSHVFSASGIYPVTLTVIDEQGWLGTASLEIRVFHPLYPSCPYPVTLELLQSTITTRASYRACRTIEIGPDCLITQNGDVTLEAGERVTFHNGFSVEPGAWLDVRIDAGLAEGS